jgi:hypothetical protein
MPYRLRYDIAIDFVPPGVGLGQQGTAPGAVGAGPAGPAQTIELFNTIGGGFPPTSNTFTSGDITALLASMSTDLSTQLNLAATLARIQAFATGGG